MINISYFISFIIVAAIFCCIGSAVEKIKRFYEGFKIFIAVVFLFYILPMLTDLIITFIINKIGITL